MVEGPVEIETDRTGTEFDRLTSLRDILFILFKYKWAIVTTFLATILATGTYMWIKEDVYEVSAKILIKKGREIALPPSVITSAPFIVSQKPEDINSEIEIFKSRELLEKVITTFGLDRPSPPPPPKGLFPTLKYHLKKVKNYCKKLWNDILIAVGLKEVLTHRDIALLELIRGLSAEAIRESNVIEVKLRLPVKENASLVLNKLLEFYLERHLEAYKNEGITNFFDTRILSLKQELEKAERTLEEFKITHNIVSVGEQENLLLKRLMENEAAIDITKSAIAETEAKVANIKASLKSESPRLITEEVTQRNPSLDILKTKIFDLIQKRTELLQKFKEDHLLIKGVNEQIKGVEDLIAAEEKSYRASSKTDTNEVFTVLRKELLSHMTVLKSLREKLAGLEKNNKRYREELNELKRWEWEFNELSRLAKVIESDYFFYKKKGEEARAADILDRQGIINVSVIEKGTDPIQPVGMRKVYIMGIVIFVGLIAGLGVVFLMELMDHSVYFPEQIEEYLGVDNLGNVRRLKANGRIHSLPFEIESDTLVDYMNLLAEMGKRLDHGQIHQLTFCASSHGEGTTTTILNLCSIAQRRVGAKILVVELNQRTPVLQKWFFPWENEGVSSIIKGEMTPSQSIIRLPFLDFDVIPFGEVGSLFSELELREAADRISNELHHHYDWIFFDSPQIFGYSDFFHIAPSGGGIILVVESGKARKEVLCRVKKMLDRHHLTLVGTILNKRKFVIPTWIYKQL